ncbi:uncharacterized protein LOC126381635 isoform X1 [Pectinophora gossypiella]|uniref:uncharacterized protein LOC126381635 isoform X1 n=2 Tax=Pectinophora gossypiella TaxID=13191 RepID=UPI00214E6051|nr:uncharacterized protein LOC126381635 isoform X1 [Pectinophora gossypiella]
MSLTCHVVKNITSDMPQFLVQKHKYHFPSYVRLADNDFDTCDKISILLGCDIFFQVLLRDQIPVVPGELFLQNTRFGFVVAGRVPAYAPTSSCLASNFCTTQSNLSGTSNEFIQPHCHLDKIVSQFWQTEKVPEVYTEGETEQQLTEQIFKESVVLHDDKFEVALPLKQDINKLHLGNSLSCALKRFHNLELRFKKDDTLFQNYKAFIDEYVDLGHAKYIDVSEYNLEDQAVFFLPHHPVFNENSLTTKLRVVFDGSMQSLSKISLNDVLLNGPVVQNDLFSILILFRLYKYILNCDIQKMFRCINVTPSHRQLQNILWRPASDSAIQCLQLQTVTYGLKSSSYLATRCLVELANRYRDQFCLASDALLHKTYVDDICLSDNDLGQLIKTRDELIQLLKKGGFSLHKWCANDNSLLQDIPLTSQHKGDVHFSEKDNSVVKNLGIKCKLDDDTLVISSPEQNLLDKYTKRDVLSFVCKIFDPLGLVGPIVVKAKLLMQQTWLSKCNWDSPLPDQLNQEFKTFADHLTKMNDIVVKRNLNTCEAKSIDIIGFADASNKAYGCSLYMRSVGVNDEVTVNLLCSKSRVNPIKELSTPRLELNSALLLAKLTKKVYDIISPRFDVNVYLYVDSQIVLAWLKTNPIKLSVYVANRIKCIIELTGNFSWYYVNTSQNPADCLSRGVEPHLLQSHDLWWHGPTFLSQLDFNPVCENVKLPKDIPELKTSHVISITEDLPLFNNCSNIDKMKRIVAYIFRFVKNCKSKKEDRIYGNLMPKELDFALKIILRNEQRKFFSQEINVLKSKQPLLKSNLKALNPFLDNMDILRVGGRLHYADIPYSKKHPIILPKGSKIVHYLIKKEHGILLHAGPKLVLTNLSQIYHIVNGIRKVKHVLHKCLICFKLKAKNAEQLMGSLPSDRVNPCRVFKKVGIDYGGPFNVKMLRVRKPVIQKAYILIFVCFITKAIHVELCTDLTTDCFLNALKRFISRRNKPSIIYCDNASTFKWHKQYIIQLQSRPKWRNVCNNIKVGSLVIVKEDNVAPLLWPLARVVDVFPGADGKVRALSIKTCKGSIVKTSIHKVCILPIDNE